MSLATGTFKKFREKALAERKERYTQKLHLEVNTTKDIASALKSTSLLAGKIILHLDSGFI